MSESDTYRDTEFYLRHRTGSRPVFITNSGMVEFATWSVFKEERGRSVWYQMVLGDDEAADLVLPGSLDAAAAVERLRRTIPCGCSPKVSSRSTSGRTFTASLLVRHSLLCYLLGGGR